MGKLEDPTIVDSRLSLVIRVHNQALTIAEALGSVMSQRVRPFEIVLVNDGSTDGSAERIELLANELDARLEVLNHLAPVGAAASFNTGVAATSGDLIVVLDADDRLGPGYLEGVVKTQEATGADVVTTDLELFGAENRYVRTKPLSRFRMAFECPAHSSSLFKRWVFDETGGRPVGMLPGDLGDDWAMWLGAAVRGARFAHAKGVVLEYRKHGKNGSLSAVGHLSSTRTHLRMHRAFPAFVGYRHIVLRALLGGWRAVLRSSGLGRFIR